MTVFLTILAGSATFVLGQIALKLFIDPVQEFKRTIADISHALIEHAPVYWNPQLAEEDDAKRVYNELRLLSSRLNAQMFNSEIRMDQ